MNEFPFIAASSFWAPHFLVDSAWHEHAPFAFWLTEVHHPRLLVELGAHHGFSYCCFCQAIQQLELETKAFTIDNWLGDDHAGFYAENVYQELLEYQKRYASFSTLLRDDFDAALSHFEDGSIDLLHIDGRHYYEDVRHDFYTWFPKLSARGLVLFHDTNVRERGFGVYKLWAELSGIYPSMEFFHGHGLGVLGVGQEIEEPLRGLLSLEKNSIPVRDWRRVYSRLGALVASTAENRSLRRANFAFQTRTQVAEECIETLRAEKSAIEQRLAIADNTAKTLKENKDANGETESLPSLLSKLEERVDRIAKEIDFRQKAFLSVRIPFGFQNYRSVSTRLRASNFGVKLLSIWRHPTSSKKRKRYRKLHFVPTSSSGTASGTPRIFRIFKRVISGSPISEGLESGRKAKPRAESPDSQFALQDLFATTSPGFNLYKQYVENSMGGQDESHYRHISSKSYSLAASDVKIIAYYLPQFHPIAENDEWWGKGFTEWRNVARAFPVFDGHYQPRVPGELGYYDLRIVDTLRRQVELAKNYGITAFCFHFYWFAGKRLLELPLLNFLENKDLDLQFSLCWANENWSRRWDGGNNEVLMSQEHFSEDDIAFIRYVSKYFEDDRYLKVDGKPVLTIYRPSIIPHLKNTLIQWREEAVKLGYPGLYLIATNTFDFTEYAELGFDALSEFPPNFGRTTRIENEFQLSPLRTGGPIYSYGSLVERELAKSEPAGTVHPGVMPGWDNSARKPHDGSIFHGATPTLFRRWLVRGLERARLHQKSERFLFINAWNEWAESAYLEPDAKYGYAWLEAVSDALQVAATTNGGHQRIVIVSHDAHPNGAQLLTLAITKTVVEFGFDVDLIVLGEGPMLGRFASSSTVHQIDLNRRPQAEVIEQLKALRLHCSELAIINATPSGQIIPLLKLAGFRTVSLIHEMPGLLNSYKLQRHACAITQHADDIVFPAEIVRKGFEEFVGKPLPRAIIKPQGLYCRVSGGVSADAKSERVKIRENLGLSADAQIVLGVGYADYRKGIDLFVDTCLKVLKGNPRTVAVWVGNHDPEQLIPQIKKIKSKGLESRFAFTGQVERPEPFYLAADVFALTSREDPFPSVVLEALDAQIPVVAFQGTGGIGELLERGCGILAPAFDTDAMGAAILSILRDPKLVSQMTELGHRIIKKEFSFSQYVQELLALPGGPLPTVSVIVPNYNYARYILGRLESIVRQTVRPYELIVLDDSSTDRSVEIIKEFLAACSVPSRLVLNKVNSGSVFRQWQRGVEMARGQIVWIAEADDLADPEFLAEVLPHFKRKDIVISFCQSRQIDGDGKIAAENYLDYVADIDGEHWRSHYVAEGNEEIGKALHVKNTIPNVSGVLFRREVLSAVLSEYGEEIMSFRHAGDWVSYIRLLERGAIAFSPKPLNSHRRHQRSVTVGNFNLRLLQEIIFVQRETNNRHRLKPDARVAADNYSQMLYEQFGLASKLYPHFSTHPSLRKYLSVQPGINFEEAQNLPGFEVDWAGSKFEASPLVVDDI